MLNHMKSASGGKHLFNLMLVILLVVLITSISSAQIPRTISFQGILTDTLGNPVDDGQWAINFRLFDAEAEGNQLWAESKVHQTKRGLFSTSLGDVTPFGASVKFDKPYWLALQAGGQPEMTPRIPLTAVGYSIKSITADTANFAKETVSGTFLPLSGGMMTGAITNTGNPAITMGKGNFGTGNINTGIDAYVAGRNNRARGDYSVVSGGGGASLEDSNSASGATSTIGGGWANKASGARATVGGGYNNEASDSRATVSGGYNNRATGLDAIVGGGSFNRARGTYSVVSGGGGETLADSNSAIGSHSTIGGGRINLATGERSTIGGGSQNLTSGFATTIAGGRFNTASSDYATVGGGNHNRARGQFSVVSGGGGAEVDSNSAIGDYSTVGGGRSNKAISGYATVGGGFDNATNGTSATVSGGRNNTASGIQSTVGGGQSNLASGSWATVGGGSSNTALGNYSFAAGRRAKANHNGAFVWADQNDADFSSGATNQFNIRASGGTRIYSNAALTAGVELPIGGNGWISASDSTKKRNIRLVNTKHILEKVGNLPIKQWSYLTQDPSIEHIGPMAQDFYAAFGLGDDEKTISTIDPAGVALAAIKGLIEENKELRTKNEELTARLHRLETVVKSLAEETKSKSTKSFGELR